MIIHSIIKRPEPTYSSGYQTSFEIKRLTQQELQSYLETCPFKPGDLVFYQGINEPYTTFSNIYQLQLITEIKADALQLTYNNYEKIPEILKIFGIGNAVESPAWRVTSRWDHMKGIRKITREEYNRFVNDRVQDYLKAHNYSWNIPE